MIRIEEMIRKIHHTPNQAPGTTLPQENSAGETSSQSRRDDSEKYTSVSAFSLFSHTLLGLYTLVNLQATGVPLLTLDGKDPPKYALQLMGALFTEEEVAIRCYKKCSAKVTKEELDQQRKKNLEGKKHHEIWFYTAIPPFYRLHHTKVWGGGIL